ncbi:MAG: hypothetical protein AAF636_11095 [Pseudomonadota bacterium]
MALPGRTLFGSKGLCPAGRTAVLAQGAAVSRAILAPAAKPGAAVLARVNRNEDKGDNKADDDMHDAQIGV